MAGAELQSHGNTGRPVGEFELLTGGVGSGVVTDRVECRSPRAHNELASRRENDGEAIFPPSISGRLPLPAESGCPGPRKGNSHEWHSVKPNTLGLKVLRTKTPARRPMINNMISISPYGKPCVSAAYSILFIYNSLTLILVRVERKSLIRKTLILIRVPFRSGTNLTLSFPVEKKSPGRGCDDA